MMGRRYIVCGPLFCSPRKLLGSRKLFFEPRFGRHYDAVAVIFIAPANSADLCMQSHRVVAFDIATNVSTPSHDRLELARLL